MKTLLSLALATTIVAGQLDSAPASPEAEPTLFRRSPWLAASLGPVAVTGLLLLPAFRVFPLGDIYIPGSPLAAVPTLAPGAFALGHAYAGDYPKAAAIAIGAPAVALGVGLAVQATYNALNPCTSFSCSGFSNLNPFAHAWALSGLAIGAWASWDAYQAVVRRDATIEATDASSAE